MVIAHGVLEQEAKQSPTRARVEEAEFKGSGEPHIHHQLPGSFVRLAVGVAQGISLRDLPTRSYVASIAV
jgi:hypothetical protein